MGYERQVEAFVEFIRSGEKIRDDFKIGVEVEHFVVKNSNLESLTYYEEKGIEYILKKLVKMGYEPVYEGDYLVGLNGKDEVITLEPGGQLEISINATPSLHGIDEKYIGFLNKIIPILDENEQLLMPIGYHPKSSINDIPFNPKKRYSHMAEYFKSTGTHGHNMMKGTASLQVVIDYSDEDDFIKKCRVANFLSPLLHLITDNAPIFEGKLYEKNIVRSRIWENTDKDRSSIVAGALGEKFGYREYSQYILNTPPIFIMKGNEIINTGAKKARHVIDIDNILRKEIDHIFSMVFPDVRVRNYIEIRMGDTLPYPLNLAYVALIKGIFYSDTALKHLFEITQSVEEEKIHLAKWSIEEMGFQGKFIGKSVKDIIAVLFDLAEQGLNESEKGYLRPLKELALDQKNPAIIMKEKIKLEGIDAIKENALNHYRR